MEDKFESMKKKWKIVIGVLLIMLAALVVYFSIGHVSRLKIGKEIGDLLQPILTEENKSMHLQIEADVNGESFELGSDIHMVKDNETSYVVMEQMDVPIYIVDNLLFFENGHAFKLAEEVEIPEQNYKNLFLQIAAAYEMFDFTCVKTDLQACYSVQVTGEQVQKLLDAAIPTKSILQEESAEHIGSETVLSGEGTVDTDSGKISAQTAIDFRMIETLQLELVAQNDSLYEIKMSGNAVLDTSEVSVEIVLSQFQILEAGAYKIPEAVQQAVATVDESTLFNLTEDLYQLLVAFDKLAKQPLQDGNVTLNADCGIIHFENTYKLNELKSMDVESVDKEGIENLPSMIGFLCMEGEIRSVETEQGKAYSLTLNQENMEKISEMVVPELVNYVVTFSEGSVEIVLENKRIATMSISIEGSIKVFFTDVPAEVGVKFTF